MGVDHVTRWSRYICTHVFTMFVCMYPRRWNGRMYVVYIHIMTTCLACGGFLAGSASREITHVQ